MERQAAEFRLPLLIGVAALQAVILPQHDRQVAAPIIEPLPVVLKEEDGRPSHKEPQISSDCVLKPAVQRPRTQS